MSKKKKSSTWIPRVEEYGVKGPILDPVRPPMPTLAYPPEEYNAGKGLKKCKCCD